MSSPTCITADVGCSWTLNQKSETNKTEWLEGTWANKTQNGNIYETWAKLSKVDLIEKSYMLKEKETIASETIRLLQEKNSIFYIPKVKNQNDTLPVRFAAKTVSDKELVFKILSTISLTLYRTQKSMQTLWLLKFQEQKMAKSVSKSSQ